VQPSNPGVVAGTLKSWVILVELVPEIKLVHTGCQIVVASVVKLMSPLFEIKNDTAVVYLVARLELDMAFVDVVIRNLPYLIRKSQGSDQRLSYIQRIITGLFNCLLKHDSKQLAIAFIHVGEQCLDAL